LRHVSTQEREKRPTSPYIRFKSSKTFPANIQRDSEGSLETTEGKKAWGTRNNHTYFCSGKGTAFWGGVREALFLRGKCDGEKREKSNVQGGEGAERR